ncbi:hypothetical protein FC98_GL001811 [Lentilactobacillus kisonensis DSM 19906 = JCM 15041]|uniref:Lipoprotein n=2 Tax=Lentilactobacillus kisonensis TaxID=481722 RepID=H1LCS0_9LACO|nr:hypothetical protein HMPREF9104_00383 [Lentilactobacillus kisonensis F0435]KRL20233.1 hypothetical protein FC98_GL001811 [Lentilactobacillus kisonensis DSM 19906 = JCM 15041]
MKVVLAIFGALFLACYYLRDAYNKDNHFNDAHRWICVLASDKPILKLRKR